MHWINLAAFVDCTEAEGPGRRAAVWVQGCVQRCPGCCNPGYLPLEARELVPSDEVVHRLAHAKLHYDIEGVTFLGGEPMLQAQGLAEVAAGVRALGLSVMVFTGYTRDELTGLDWPGVAELLRVTDVLVDGKYDERVPEPMRNWVGSRNQAFHYLTDHYDAGIETDPRWAPSLEIRLALGGTGRWNGWPTGVRARPRSA